jgi:hypothetical protein
MTDLQDKIDKKIATSPRHKSMEKLLFSENEPVTGNTPIT